MAQQFIDFGTFPNDPAADPLRAAFQKIQNNFTELYGTQVSAGVISLDVGPGLTQNSNVGNILIQTSFPNITIQTSNNILVGVGAATSNTATISSYSTPIVLNLANTITTQNANLTNSVRTVNLNVTGNVVSTLNPNSNVTLDIGTSTQRWRTIYVGNSGISLGTQSISSNSSGVILDNLIVNSSITVANLSVVTNTSLNTLTVANLSLSGYLKTSIVPDVSNVYDLGSATNRFKDLWLSGNTLKLGGATVSDNGDAGIAIQSATITGNLNVGNVTAAYLGGTVSTAAQPGITSVGILSGLSVSGNIATGSISVIGNVEAANLNTTGTISAGSIVGNVILPPGATIQAPGANTQLLFNDGGNTAAQSGLTFDKVNNLLSISGNVSGGNLVTSGGLSVTGNGVVGNLSTTGLTASGTVNAGNLITVGILASSANISGNVTTNGFLSVVGNASAGNITTTTLTGQVVSVSGNISGANLVASGVLRVDGNANVGNLTTSGLVSAATVQAAAMAANSMTSNTTIAALGTITGGNFITSGGLNVSGLAAFGNASAGNFTVNGSITGAATMESQLLNVTGNMTGGNVLTNGFLSVVGNAIAGNINTGGVISATGNVSAGNLVTSGSLSALNGSLSTMLITSLINASGATANINTVNSSILSVVGNASAGNLATEGTLSVTGNAVVGNVNTGFITTSSSISVGQSATIANLLTVNGNIVGSNANINKLEAASFFATTANVTNINLSGGILSMGSANASIGNIAAGILAATGNVSGGNLITSGYLAVTGNASANRLTVASGIVNNTYNVGGQIIVGANLQIQTTGSSGNGVVATMAFSSTQDAPPFPTGQTIIVSGLVPSSFNGTFSVLTSNTTHVTYNSAVIGLVTTGGFVRSSGTGMVLQGTANVGGLNSTGNISAGNVSGGTFTATLFSGNGASITGINMLNTGMSVIVTATAGTGTVQTLSFATQSYAPFSTGQSITVSGLVPSGYNGTYTVATCTTTAVTMVGSATGSMTQTGVIVGGPKSQSAVTAESIINGSQPNITSIGTLTGLTLSGAFTGTDITSAGYMLTSVGGGIAAAGTILSTATGLTKQVNVVTSATAGVNDGIRLPGATTGMQIIIINTTTVGVKVYPANGGTIDELGVNTSFTLGPKAKLMCVATSTTQWYTMVGVYG